MKLCVLGVIVSVMLFGCNSDPTNPGPSSEQVEPYSAEITSLYTSTVAKADLTFKSFSTGLTSPLVSPDTVVKLLKAMPGIASVEPADTTGNAVIAHIGSADGPIYAVMWRSMAVSADTTELGDMSDSTRLQKALTDNRIPTGSKVQLFSALNGRGYPDWTPKAKQIFDYAKNKYSAFTMAASIENLRTVNNTDVMIFYTHGILGTSSKNVLVLATTNPFDSALIKTTYKDDWDNKRLGSATVAIAEIPWTEPGKRWRAKGADEMATVFCINENFVTTYWDFNDHSLVVLDACYSMAPGAQSFRNTVFSCNASVIWGWIGRGHANLAEKSTLMLLDRLLGTNIVKPVREPLQRPFDRTLSAEAVHKEGIDSWVDGGSASSKLFAESPVGNKMTLLAPTIKYLAVDEKAKKLTINGTFGDDKSKGEVTIEEKPMTISSWTDTKIECELKPDDCGPVQVKYADHKSNKKNLSLWEISFKYTVTGPQAIYVELLAKVRWRADLAKYREKPEEEATHREVTIMPGRTSTGDYSAIGSATIDDDGSVTYSGSGKVPSPYADEYNPTNAVMYWAQFLPGDTTTLKVWSKVLIYPAYTAVYKGKDSRTVEQPIALPDKLVITKEAYQPSAVISLDEMILAGSMPLVNKLTFDADYTIAKGQCGPVVVSGPDGSSEYLLSWEQCTPKFPPLKNGRL